MGGSLHDVLFDDGLADAGTHVLLIGVGKYPHLPGGTPPAFAMAMGMGQLESPPESVRRMAEWFMDAASGFHNPDRPLRSLQILCSSKVPLSMQGANGMTLVDGARMPAARQAITDWKVRSGRNPENMAVFFFCGHGLAFGEVENSLLLEDFGSDVHNPMADAIAFDSMRLGLMRHCTAKYQVHLVDACRSPPTREFLDLYGDNATGDPVLAAGLSRKLREKTAPVYFATGLASPAYGVPGQASLFTQGLLQSMRGPASRDKNNHWEVQISALAEGINKCVASMAFQSQPQYCQPRDTGQEVTLHRLRDMPEVIVKVFRQDEGLLPQTVFAHVHEDLNHRTERTPPKGAPWWVSLASGPYRFEAAAPGLQLALRSKYVTPPSAEVGL
jgi:Caspase domain